MPAFRGTYPLGSPTTPSAETAATPPLTGREDGKGRAQDTPIQNPDKSFRCFTFYSHYETTLYRFSVRLNERLRERVKISALNLCFSAILVRILFKSVKRFS